MEAGDKNHPRNRVNGSIGGRDQRQLSERLTRRDFCSGLAKWSKGIIAVVFLMGTQELLPSYERNYFPSQMAPP